MKYKGNKIIYICTSLNNLIMIKKFLLVFITLCTLQVNAQTNTSKIAIIENFWTERYTMEDKPTTQKAVELHLAKYNPTAYSEFQKYKLNKALGWISVAAFTGFMAYGTIGNLQENTIKTLTGYTGAGIFAATAIGLEINSKLKRQKAINIYNNM